MAATGEAIDFKEFITTDDLPLERFHEVRRELHCHVDLRTRLEELLADFDKIVKEFPSENKAEVRRGIGKWLLGLSEQAIPILEPARTSKEKEYFLGVSCLEAGVAGKALGPLKEAYGADSSDPLISVAYCEAKIQAGKHEEAETHVERLLKKAPSAAAWYLKGLLADMQGFYDDAVEAYEKSLEIEPGYPRALFRLAYVMDLTGEDARAMELYEQLRKLRPMHLNTVINLGVLYEDRGEYDRAVRCYQSILDYFPTHSRARLYLKDAQASLTMFYDEDAARREAKVTQVLAQPVAEISFSPRVRGALEKLGIISLGELVGKSEEELLGIPNFGRTSLRELKEYLSSKGLGLASAGGPGGLLEEGGPAPEMASGSTSDDVIKKNLADFEWSGRIRKVFEKMGLVTVGDLMERTEKDLLKSKNLGLTSIKDIRRKLGQLGFQMNLE